MRRPWCFLILWLTLGFLTDSQAQILPSIAGGTTVVGGTCLQQVMTGLSSLGVPVCTTVTKDYTDQSLAQTGVDLNTAHEVIAAHLSAPLPFLQGGHGLTSGASGGLLYFPTTTSLGSSLTLQQGMPVLGGGSGQPPTTGTLSGDTTRLGTVSGPLTSNRQLLFDVSGNIAVSAFAPGTPTQPGLTWNVVTGGCTADPNGGKLTISGTAIVCGVDVSGTSTPALADPGSPGILVRTTLGITAARTIQGTPNQIDVANGDGQSAAPVVIGLATNATLFGTTTGTFSGSLIGNASTATALAADPLACPTSPQQFVTDMAANGTLSCAVPAGGVSATGTPTLGQLALWTSATVLQGVTTLPDANLASVNATPGTFTRPDLTVDTKGRITLISNGGDAACLTKITNANGIAGADILVSTTLTTIITPAVTLCKALVLNTSTTQAVRCRGPENGLVTAVAGLKIPAGAALTLDAEARTGLDCIRDTSATADASLSVMEVHP